MKKVFIFFFALNSILSFSQAINVNTTTYTVPELVNNVLINSPCAIVNNITWRTGTNFGSTNGIGYFNNANTNFPISSGIVLSTGNVASTVGPNSNTQSNGNSSWTGDSQLFNYFTGLGIDPSLSSFYNASVLEFDFIPGANEMSFNFVFASEEYGAFQCSFSDAFAFFLTDLTTQSQPINIALVPNTLLPISVVTVRDSQYNNGCTSQNPEYFGIFNNQAVTPTTATNFNGETVLMTASSNVIPNHTYHIKMVIADRNDASFDSAIFIEAGSFNIGNTNCNDIIEMVVFNDDNQNGIKDNNEQNFNNGSFHYINNSTTEEVNLYSPIGTNRIFINNYDDTFNIDYNIENTYTSYYDSSTNFQNYSIAQGSGINTLYFPIILTQPYSDLEATLIPTEQPVAGFDYNNRIVIKNKGVQNSSGSINFIKDNNVTINSVSDVNYTPTSNGFTLDYTDLTPNETRTIDINMSVPSIPTVSLGDILTNSISVNVNETDINLNNNNSNVSQIIVGSFDPNDIIESHGDKIQFDQFTNNDYLFYTIRFQNTGTANALNVRLENILDSKLDESSIIFVNSNYNYTVERINNQLTWNFENINLVPSMTNEELSKGFVTYKIKPKPVYAIGDIIPNTANIYFDFNPAITTNTFNTEFVAALANTTFEETDFVMHPNPATNLVTINLKNNAETINSIAIYDVLGKKVKSINSISSSNLNIDVSDLSKGIYIVKLKTDSNIELIKKLVIK